MWGELVCDQSVCSNKGKCTYLNYNFSNTDFKNELNMNFEAN